MLIKINDGQGNYNEVVVKGVKGDTGAKGDQGIQGIQGEKGESWLQDYISISNLSGYSVLANKKYYVENLGNDISINIPTVNITTEIELLVKNTYQGSAYITFPNSNIIFACSPNNAWSSSNTAIEFNPGFTFIKLKLTYTDMTNWLCFIETI